MTSEEVAARLGCAVSHVTHLCRNKKLTAKRVMVPHGKDGFKRMVWFIDKASVEKYLKKPIKRGWKRGTKRS